MNKDIKSTTLHELFTYKSNRLPNVLTQKFTLTDQLDGSSKMVICYLTAFIPSKVVRFKRNGNKLDFIEEFALHLGSNSVAFGILSPGFPGEMTPLSFY